MKARSVNEAIDIALLFGLVTMVLVLLVLTLNTEIVVWIVVFAILILPFLSQLLQHFRSFRGVNTDLSLKDNRTSKSQASEVKDQPQQQRRTSEAQISAPKPKKTIATRRVRIAPRAAPKASNNKTVSGASTSQNQQ